MTPHAGTQTLPRIRRAIVSALRAAAVIIVSAACTDVPPPGSGPAAALVVRPSSVTLRAGETVQLSAQVNDAMGRPLGGASITYTAGVDSLVRVTSVGLVSAAGSAGSASVLVSSDTLTRAIPVTVVAGAPGSIEVADGSGQLGTAGAMLDAPIAIMVRDVFGNPTPRVPLQLTLQTGGSVVPATLSTDAVGTARVRWTLGPVAGVQVLLVRAESVTTTVDAVARPGPMTQVVDVDPRTRRTHAGDTIAVRLRALDAFGNGVPGTVFAFSVAEGRGDVLPARVESDSNGIAVTRWRTDTLVGTNALRARAFQTRDTTFELRVRTLGGAAAALRLLSGDGQRVRAGLRLPRSPQVKVVDRYGNPVAAVRVRFRTDTTRAAVAPAEVITDDEGVAQPSAWILGQAGEHQLQVIADGVRDTVRVRARATAR